MGSDCIKTKVNLKEFEKCAADRVPLGVITKESGATITRMGMDGRMQTVEANVGDKLYKGDVIRTPEKGSLQITLPDHSVLSSGPNSSVDMSQFELAPALENRGRHGTMDVINGKPTSPTEGRTPMIFSASTGVRG